MFGHIDADAQRFRTAKARVWMTIKGQGKQIEAWADKTWRWDLPCGKVGIKEMNWFLLTADLARAEFVHGLTGFGFGLVSMSLVPLFLGIK
jgi:hypothetical protein